MNFRFGMVLEVATAAGSVLGGLTAQMLAQATLQKLFGVVDRRRRADHVDPARRRRNVILDPTRRSRACSAAAIPRGGERRRR